jgi:hypothetical protein
MRVNQVFRAENSHYSRASIHDGCIGSLAVRYLQQSLF